MVEISDQGRGETVTAPPHAVRNPEVMEAQSRPYIVYRSRDLQLGSHRPRRGWERISR